MVINYKTTFSDFSTLNIRAKIEELRGKVLNNTSNDQEKLELEQLKIELALRSVNKTGGVTIKEGLAICEEECKKNPQHNFYNLIRALHENNTDRKIAFLMTAANSNQPVPAEKKIGAIAAYALANVYSGAKKYIESLAWMAMAIMQNLKDAEENFLDSKRQHGRVVNLLSEQLDSLHPALQVEVSIVWRCAFLAVVFAGKKFSRDLIDQSWLKEISSYTEAYKRDFVRSNAQPNPLATIHELYMPSYYAMYYVVMENPVVVHRFFSYCYAIGIITDTVFLNVLDFLVKNKDTINIFFNQYNKSQKNDGKTAAMEIQMMEDRINYSFMVVYLRQNNMQGAYDSLEKISGLFKDYKVSDLCAPTESERDHFSYMIFKKLFENKHNAEAMPFLNNVQDCHVYEMDMLDYFKIIDPEDKNTEYRNFKRDILNRILRKENANLFSKEFIEEVQSANDIVDDLYKRCKAAFQAIIELVEEKIGKPEKAKSSFRQDKSILEWVSKLSRQNDVLTKMHHHDLTQFQSLHAVVKAYILRGEMAILGKTLTRPFSSEPTALEKIFIEAENKLDEITHYIASINTIEDAKKNLQAQENNLPRQDGAIVPESSSAPFLGQPVVYPPHLIDQNGIPYIMSYIDPSYCQTGGQFNGPFYYQHYYGAYPFPVQSLPVAASSHDPGLQPNDYKVELNPEGDLIIFDEETMPRPSYQAMVSQKNFETPHTLFNKGRALSSAKSSNDIDLITGDLNDISLDQDTKGVKRMGFGSSDG